MPLRFKFVELSIVTDETIETTVNTWVAGGWRFDGIQFVTTDKSRRPQMAFVAFCRDVADEAAADLDVESPIVRARPRKRVQKPT